MKAIACKEEKVIYPTIAPIFHSHKHHLMTRHVTRRVDQVRRPVVEEITDALEGGEGESAARRRVSVGAFVVSLLRSGGDRGAARFVKLVRGDAELGDRLTAVVREVRAEDATVLVGGVAGASARAGRWSDP